MTPAYSWTPLIIAHAGLALTALTVGSFILVRSKGTRAHRIAGWLWVLTMASVALSSFAIHQVHYSWIHGLSVFTLVALVIGVSHARAHRVGHHRGWMRGLFYGALVITGLFTLLPGRLIGHALWSLGS